MKKVFRILPHILYLLVFLMVGSSCKRFVFGEVIIDEENNPLTEKKVPRTGADLFTPPVVDMPNLPNPDRDGAFADWATCLVMFKEGHPHGGGKLHGNFMYAKAPWRQEQFAVIHNTPEGIKVKVDKESVITYIEKNAGKQGPDYFRIIGGNSKLWGLCLYFYDKEGKLLNEKILERSEEYQIFFSISDKDDKGNPYRVMDVRYNESGSSSVPSTYFADKETFESRRQETPKLFVYTYRDTWQHDDMADGVRELFNLRLLPPLTRRDHAKATLEDQDYIGLKGHIKFDVDSSVGPLEEWPIARTDGRLYNRTTNLLPHFYIAVRVMKCAKGKKAVLQRSNANGDNKYKCAPFYDPSTLSGWDEIIRINLPVKVFTNTYDSDPTDDDPNEPYFYHLGKEIGTTSKEAYDAIKNIVIHSDDGSGGLGFGAWFL